jgi:hypothetical protein
LPAGIPDWKGVDGKQVLSTVFQIALLYMVDFLDFSDDTRNTGICIYRIAWVK